MKLALFCVSYAPLTHHSDIWPSYGKSEKSMSVIGVNSAVASSICRATALVALKKPWTHVVELYVENI